MATTKPEVVNSYNYASVRDRNTISASTYVFEDAKVNGTSTDIKFCIVLHEFSLSGSMASSKPEVVITMRRYEIEIRFRRLFSRTPKSMEHRPTSGSV